MKNMLCIATFTAVFFIFTSEAGAAGISTSRSNLRNKSAMAGDSVSTQVSDDSMQSEAKSPRDAASGMPTGKRQHKPMMMRTKEVDKSTPPLMEGMEAPNLGSQGQDNAGISTAREAGTGKATGKAASPSEAVPSPEASMEKLCPGSPNCPPEPADASAPVKPTYDLKEMKK